MLASEVTDLGCQGLVGRAEHGLRLDGAQLRADRLHRAALGDLLVHANSPVHSRSALGLPGAFAPVPRPRPTVRTGGRCRARVSTSGHDINVATLSPSIAGQVPDL